MLLDPVALPDVLGVVAADPEVLASEEVVLLEVLAPEVSVAGVLDVELWLAAGVVVLSDCISELLRVLRLQPLIASDMTARTAPAILIF